jgi:uncharacterized protein (UPF0333 family)
MKKRRVLLITLVVIVLAGLAGAYFYFKQTPDVVQGKPDASVSAKELIAAFQQDASAAKERYLDKVVEVTGTVKHIDPSGTVVLGEEGMASDIVAGLDRRHLNDHEKLKKGSVAVIQGICSGYTIGGSADPADMLASLGTTVQLRSAGVKSVK